MNEVYVMFQTLPLSLILLCKINVDALEYKHSPKYTPGGMHVQTLKQHTFPLFPVTHTCIMNTV